MQGLADGYFVIPSTLSNYLGANSFSDISVTNDAFSEAENLVNERFNKFLEIKGSKTVDDFHKELGIVMWNNVGMSRNTSDLKDAIQKIPKIKEEFWQNMKIPGDSTSVNLELEKANRVADFLEMGELMARDALEREESCGGHFRDEHQTEENEAKRDDENFTHVAAWEHLGDNKTPTRHKEELKFENVKLTTRSYK